MRGIRISLLWACCFASLASAISAAVPPIASVHLSRGVFNPSLQQSVTLSFTTPAGVVDARVLDRDGVPVRTLAKQKAFAGGLMALTWDGRNDDGAVVPNEAYSFRIDWSSGTARDSYFPAASARDMIAIPVKYYDRRGGTLAYELPVASRVHLQTGTATTDARGEASGPVLKTVVNREPRAAGAIAEHWDGRDESGTIFVPDLPDFVTAIAAEPLPENAVITIGNRERTFLDYAATRKAASLLPHTATHTHHRGLDVFFDVSPAMTLQPVEAKWNEAEKVWVVRGRSIRVPTSIRHSRSTATTSSSARRMRRLSRRMPTRIRRSSLA
jgi:hypothetical protein